MCEWNKYPNSQREAETRGRAMLGKFHRKYQQSQLGYTLNFWLLEWSPDSVIVFRRVVYEDGLPTRPNMPVQG
jgi:hypothetical protein